MGGFIKLHRKVLENPISCKDSDYFAVWVYLLLEATHKEIPKLFKGEKIMLQPGQLLTGRKSISEKFGISESKVQRILKDFENEQQIEQQTSNKNRLVTILSWSTYQHREQQDEQPMNNQRTTDEQPVNTNKKLINKEYKESNKEDLKDMSVPTETNNINQLFEEWWKSYPNKGSKKTALSSFTKEKAYLDMDKLNEGTKSYIDFQTKKGYDICMGATFLNQRRWEGEWVIGNGVKISNPSKPAKAQIQTAKSDGGKAVTPERLNELAALAERLEAKQQVSATDYKDWR